MVFFVYFKFEGKTFPVPVNSEEHILEFRFIYPVLKKIILQVNRQAIQSKEHYFVQRIHQGLPAQIIRNLDTLVISESIIEVHRSSDA